MKEEGARWRVAHDNARVRSERSKSSKSLGVKPRGTLVMGHQEGNWVMLANEPGNMMITADDGTAILVQDKVGSTGSSGAPPSVAGSSHAAGSAAGGRSVRSASSDRSGSKPGHNTAAADGSVHGLGIECCNQTTDAFQYLGNGLAGDMHTYKYVGLGNCEDGSLFREGEIPQRPARISLALIGAVGLIIMFLLWASVRININHAKAAEAATSKAAEPAAPPPNNGLNVFLFLLFVLLVGTLATVVLKVSVSPTLARMSNSDELPQLALPQVPALPSLLSYLPPALSRMANSDHRV